MCTIYVYHMYHFAISTSFLIIITDDLQAKSSYESPSEILTVTTIQARYILFV